MNNNTNEHYPSKEKHPPYFGKATHFARGTAAALAVLLATGNPALGARPVPPHSPNLCFPQARHASSL
jgi:hypothetical protein